MSDPVRLRLLSLIANVPEGTACSCDLEGPVGKSQPTVSDHLAVLADAGLITKVKVRTMGDLRGRPGATDHLASRARHLAARALSAR